MFGKKSKQEQSANNRLPYIVEQIVLGEPITGLGSGSEDLKQLQILLNKYAEKGYRLHTMSTTSTGHKGTFSGYKIHATLVFERLDMKVM